jgi:glycosyltransferase involved in cell wall biosynthesis
MRRIYLANLLILSKDLPYPLDNGHTLRVFHPCCQLARQHTCILVSFGEKTPHLAELERKNIFKKVYLIEPAPQVKSLLRHFRWSNKDFVKLSAPQYHKQVVTLLQTLVQRHAIDVVLTFPAILTEFVDPLKNVRKIADSCDCITLTYERLFAHQKKGMSALMRMSSWLSLQRFKNFEKKLPESHDSIVSISPADLNTLKKLSKSSDHHFTLIPNGVDAELLAHKSHESEIDNAIVFWGNLNFAPNYSAVDYFYSKIYQPFLAAHHVKWYIVGKHANQKILQMATDNKNIIVTGFIDKLYDFAARIPIMINPMLIGSGLKNKVLEAFALKRLVVSNSLGMEAIIGAQAGVHYIHAEQPKAFADAILFYMNDSLGRKRIGENARQLVEERYTWDRIGRQWNQLIADKKETLAAIQFSSVGKIF